ncbi:MAG: metal-dependent hydrolase [Candidatus Rokubacteria bacterium]|nr:metal-dependent hydrolase [Candidatus Rokubacteria bacterium]
MDPLTHGLAGAALAQAGFRQRCGYQATLAMTAGAMLPDIDVLWSPAQSVVALETHRGMTHSLVGAVGLAFALGFALRFVGPERRWGPLAGLSLLGIAIGHLFLDLITSYGIQLYLPFSRARPALDLVFIIDPFLTLTLLIAVVAGFVWRRSAAVIGKVALAAIVLYLGMMALNHSAAVTRMEELLQSQGVAARRVEALPWPFNPLRWQGFAEDGDRYWQGDVRLWRGGVTLTGLPKGPADGPVARAREHKDVQTFLWFARFPVVALREDGNRAVVEYRDLRFAQSLRSRSPFVLRVLFSPSGEVEQVLFNP